MSYNFKRLADVDAVANVQDTDTVLIVQDGSVKQAAKDSVGGSGTVYFVRSGSSYRSGKDWDTGADVTAADIVSAYENGAVKVFFMYYGEFTGVGDVIGYFMYQGTPNIRLYDPSSNEVSYG